MCLAVPAEIVKIDGAYALVHIMGIEARVYIQLIEEPKNGDYVLIHAGCAIEKINKEYSTYLEELHQNIMNRNEMVNE